MKGGLCGGGWVVLSGVDKEDLNNWVGFGVLVKEARQGSPGF